MLLVPAKLHQQVMESCKYSTNLVSYRNNKIGLMATKQKANKSNILTNISESLRDSLYIFNTKHDCFIISILQSIKYCNTLYNELKGDRQTIKCTLLSLECEESWIDGFFNFFFEDKWCGVSFTDVRKCLFGIYNALKKKLTLVSLVESVSLVEFYFYSEADLQPMEDPLLFLRWLLVNVFQRPETNIQQTLMCSTCAICQQTTYKTQQQQIDCIRIENQKMLDDIANGSNYHSSRPSLTACERCKENNVTYIDEYKLQTSSGTVVINCQSATMPCFAIADNSKSSDKLNIANESTVYVQHHALKVPETIKLQSVTYYLTAALMKTGPTNTEGHYFLRIKVNDALNAVVHNKGISKVKCERRSSCYCSESSVRERKMPTPCGALFCP
jgi:hypothetical protein